MVKTRLDDKFATYFRNIQTVFIIFWTSEIIEEMVKSKILTFFRLSIVLHPNLRFILSLSRNVDSTHSS